MLFQSVEAHSESGGDKSAGLGARDLAGAFYTHVERRRTAQLRSPGHAGAHAAD